MAQRPKQNCSKHSGSMSMIQEIPSISSSSEEAVVRNRNSSICSKGAIPKNKYSSKSYQQQASSSEETIPVKKKFSHENKNAEITMKKEKSRGIRGFFGIFGQRSKKRRKLKSPKIYPNIPLHKRDIRQLIELYYRYNCLYDPEHPQYGDREITEICYLEIASYFPKKTARELQGYIYDLRLLFEREFSIIENARRRYGETIEPSIKYYTEFLFLVPYLNVSSSENGSLIESDRCTISSLSNSSTDDLAECQENNRKDIKGKISGANETEHRKGSLQRQQRIEKSQDQQQYSQQQQLQDAENSQTNTVGRSIISKRSVAGKTIADYRTMSLQAVSDFVSGNKFASIGKKKNNVERKNASLDIGNKSEKKQNNEMEMEEEEYPRKQKKGKPESSDETNSQDNPNPEKSGKKQKSGKIKEQKQEEKSIDEENDNPASNLEAANPECSGCDCGQLSQAENRPEDPDCGSPETPSNSSTKENREQVQVLCDMIKMELGSVPDFIYYDAKWRIIEILRDVQNRQMIQLKGIQTAPNSICSAKSSPRPSIIKYQTQPQKPRICCPQKASLCPYCCCKK